MLAAVDLSLWRGATCLFTGLSFRAEPGTALVLKGANGSGKTSLLRVLAGLTRPETGSVHWAGERLPDGLRSLAAYSGHSSALSPDLTLTQNLRFYARLTGWTGDLPALIAFLGLTGLEDLEVRFLSAGQRRRGGLARLLMADLPVWLLDEPFTNLDAAGRALVEACIAGHLARGRLAVVAAHDELTLDSSRLATLRLGMN